MDDVEALRRAAEKARELAGAVPPGPWTHAVDGMCYGGGTDIWPAVFHTMPSGERQVLQTFDASRDGGALADQMASWHPGVALAVADWWDASADEAELIDEGINSKAWLYDSSAVRAARVFLGEADPG